MTKPSAEGWVFVTGAEALSAVSTPEPLRIDESRRVDNRLPSDLVIVIELIVVVETVGIDTGRVPPHSDVTVVSA